MTRKPCLLIIIFILLLTITACNSYGSNSKISIVENYKETAEKFVKSNDIVSAKKILQEGIKLTNSDELKAILKNLSYEDSYESSSTNEEIFQDNLIENMTDTQRVELNIFLSNFSEAHFNNYSSTNFSESQLISFAFAHNNINNPNKIIREGMNMGISATDANATIQKYFGETIPKTSIGEWMYENGNYYTKGSTGESYALFTIASQLTKNNDSTLNVKFSVFYDKNNMFETSLSEWYSYTMEQAKNFCVLSGTGNAIIKPKTYNNKNTYELIEYTYAPLY